MVQMALCAACDRPIKDPFIHSVLNKNWHKECIRCADCHVMLDERCFEREGRLFCHVDYLRRFGPKCHACLEYIPATEMVRRSRGQSYHLKCLSCLVCHRQLTTGDSCYAIENNRFICKDNYCSTFQLQQTVGQLAAQPSTVGAAVAQGMTAGHENVKCDPVVNEATDLSVAPEAQSKPRSVSDPIHHPSSNGSCDGPNESLVQAAPDASEAGPGTCGSIVPTAGSTGDLDLHPASVDSLVKEEPNNNNTEERSLDGSLDNKLFDKENENSLDDLKSTYSAASTPEEKIGEAGSDQGQGDAQSTGGQTSGSQPGTGTKRRGPRTTIKAKQLDTLKAAFAATPKPTRHVREQLAQETGLTMRVIQVWFQNRRSKERRMKQLSAMGARRPFFRNPRRMRTLRGGLGPDELGPDGAEMMANPAYHGYFAGNHPDFYNAVAAAGGFVPPGFPGEFYHPGQGPPPHFLTSGPTVSMAGVENPNMHASMDGQFYANPDYPGPPNGATSPNDHMQGRHLDSPFGMPPCSMGNFQSGVPEAAHMAGAIPNMESW